MGAGAEAADVARRAAADLLGPLERFSRRVERSRTWEETTHEVVAALGELFGFRDTILFAIDAPTGRLLAIAGSGAGRSAVGTEVEIGHGPVGTAAARRRLVLTPDLTRSWSMTPAINGSRVERRRHESAAAVPLVVGDELIGVLCLERAQPCSFGGRIEGLLRIIGSQTAAALAARRAPGADERLGAMGPAPAADGERSLELVYYQADDTVLCDSVYVVKGAPGRILWSMLEAHAASGRTQFSNRELRLDESLGLPVGNDNLEARLLVLRRRLADIDCGVALVRVGRGRLELTVERPAVLTVVPTARPMHVVAHLSDS